MDKSMSSTVPGDQAPAPTPAAKKKSAWDLLKNPWILLIAMGLGFFVGQNYKTFAQGLIFPGELYLSLFQMSVIPIISTSIIVGLARMLRSGSASQYLGRMVTLFIIAVLTGSALGIIFGFLLEPGNNLARASQAFIGQALLEDQQNRATEAGGLTHSFSQLSPSTVYSAFSSGKVLGIIFASVMIGAAMGGSRSVGSERFLEVVEGAQEIFSRILGWVVYGLPIGVFFLIAGQVSVLGMEAVMALSKFVLVLYLACLALWIIYLLIMRFATGMSLGKIIMAISRPLFVSFSAASSIAPIPMAQKNLKQDLNQPSNVVDFVLPLSVAMNRHSYAMLFALTTVFLAQLFGKSLDFSQTLFILFTSALIGMAAAGRLPIAAPMIGYVLVPLGMPVTVGVTIFITIGTILDPIIQSSILFGSCANTTILGKLGQNQEQDGEVENSAPEPQAAKA